MLVMPFYLFCSFFNHPVFSFWAFRSPLPVGALVHGSTRPVHKVVVTGNRQYCYTLAHLPGQSCNAHRPGQNCSPVGKLLHQQLAD
jgi:hypothetical protein